MYEKIRVTQFDRSIDENMDFKALLQAEINRKRQKIESKDVLVR